MEKLFIFDLDGTLYHESNQLSEIIDEKIKNYIMYEAKLTENEYIELEKNVPNLLKALKELKINKKNFYKEVYKNIDYKKYLKKNSKLKKELYKIKGKKIICTNSCKYHAEEVLESLGISELFEKIYSTEEYKNKFEIYKIILEKYNLLPNEIIVIGNDYNVDIQPAKLLGFKTEYIEKGKVNNIEDVIRKVAEEKERLL